MRWSNATRGSRTSGIWPSCASRSIEVRASGLCFFKHPRHAAALRRLCDPRTRPSSTTIIGTGFMRRTLQRRPPLVAWLISLLCQKRNRSRLRKSAAEKYRWISFPPTAPHRRPPQQAAAVMTVRRCTRAAMSMHRHPTATAIATHRRNSADPTRLRKTRSRRRIRRKSNYLQNTRRCQLDTPHPHNPSPHLASNRSRTLLF